jgi:kynureninase
VKKDPRTATTEEEFNKQLELALQIRDRISAANQAVLDIQGARHQLDGYAKSADPKVSAAAKGVLVKLDPIENAIYQTKLRANEDALNFPIKLNNKLASLMSTVTASDVAPTSQSYEVFKELSAQLQVQLDQLKQVESQDVAAFNKTVRDQDIPAIQMKN